MTAVIRAGVSTELQVRLSLPELRHAAYVGMDRYVRALSQSRVPQYGVSHDDWQAHVLGAWGECVVAKSIGRYWSGDLGRPDGGAPDVGTFHVRTTFVPDGRLILHEADDDAAPFVLVIPAGLPHFSIIGWCYGHEGKIIDHWQTATGRPAYFVPRSVLRPWCEITT